MKNVMWPASLLLLLALAPPSASALLYPVTIERGTPVRMRDGVLLRADIYHPQTNGRFPTLLLRTPYNKDKSMDFSLKAAAKGYIVIVEDVRGRYSSDGEWYPFKYESQDGYDTIEWAATLPYSDGRVGLFGGSYEGATQLLAAIATPPHLAGICPVVTASNYHDGWTYQSGAFEQWFNESWTTNLSQDTLTRMVKRSTNAMESVGTLPLARYGVFGAMDLPSGADLTKVLAPYFLDWLAHPNHDDYWRRWSIEEHYGDIQVPALTVAAWYDIFQGGSLRNYLGLRSKAGNKAARDGQRLLITIGGHAGQGRTIGELDFGPRAAEYDEQGIVLDWYDYLFKGIQNSLSSQKRVRLFVMGDNLWREEEEWPLARSRVTKYYLHSTRAANSATGDGRLSIESPGTEAPDHYLYNPEDPVPTVGGPLCCDREHLPAGPRDQRGVEARKDVLVYSTPPLPDDVEVTGPVTAELYAQSSAVDTDFTAKLVDVWPNGFAQNLAEGILRACYRASQNEPEWMHPGETYQLHIDLSSTSNVFHKGHQIRLEISSSNFPRFSRNLNTSDQQGSSATMVKAQNTILHDAQHPSALILPLIVDANNRKEKLRSHRHLALPAPTPSPY